MIRLCVKEDDNSSPEFELRKYGEMNEVDVYVDGDRIGYFGIRGSEKIRFFSDEPIDTDLFDVDDSGYLICNL